MSGVLIDSRDVPTLGTLLRAYRHGALGASAPPDSGQAEPALPVRAMLLADLDTRTLGDTAAVDAVVTQPNDDPNRAAVQYVIRITTGVLPDEDADPAPLPWRCQVGTSYTPDVSEEATAAELQALLAGMTELGNVTVEVDGPGRPRGANATPWDVRQWFVRLTPRNTGDVPPVLSAAVPLVDQATASVTRTRWWPTERIVRVHPLWPLADTLFGGTFVWAELKGRWFNVVSHECWEQGQ